MVTIDASVFVSAVVPTEANHTASVAFLQRVRQKRIRVRCPGLVLAECAAAIARPTGNAAAAQSLCRLVEGFPRIRLVATNRARARRAADVAAIHRLRGADAIYTATATEARAVLVTWDGEMLQRATAVVQVMTPTEWLAANP